jgi:hypothetical protein
VLFQFKQEEFDKKEFNAGKKRLYLRRRENFSSDLPLNEFLRAQNKAEIQWNLTKRNIEQGNKAIQHDHHHYVTFDNDDEAGKKRTWADIIFSHSDIFKVKNLMALKQKKRMIELAIQSAGILPLSPEKEKDQENTFKKAEAKSKQKTHVKDVLQVILSFKVF